ncbi:MAG: hypothetical protein IKS98_13745 [Lachnospiraceae bacterium]|nr:hypothetical protein [Lachnospiraceae bacterium]
MNRKFQYGLATIIIAIIVLFVMGKDAVSLLKEPVELDGILDIDKVKNLKAGDHVILKVKLNEGEIASVYTTKNGVNQGDSSRYYVIPFFDDTLENFYGLLVNVAKKDFNKMDNAYAVTEQFYNGEIEWPTQTFATFEGVMEKFSKDEEKYMGNYADAGYYDSIVLHSKVKGFSIGVSVAAIVAIIIGVLLTVSGIKQGKVTSANNKALAASNYYTAPTNVSFNNDPNAAAQPQAPPQAFDPYSVQNDPRFTGAVNNAQAAAQTTVQNASNAADQAVTSFNEVKTDVQEAATTSFNEVPIAPIADVPPINPKDPLDK